MLKVPHLNTALTVPLLDLEKKCLELQNSIEHWFRLKWHDHRAPFYGSVDLRNSGFKLTPVDMNLFPGGFNNINPSFIPLAVHAVQYLLDKYNYQARKFLLIPENHTRNQAYLHNVYTLLQIFRQAGVEIQIGSLSPEITEITEVTLSDGKKLVYHPIKREGNVIKTLSGFNPCCIILNNDLSSGRPAILEDLKQHLFIPLNAGWYMRKKTNFFTEYDKVCDEFGKLIGIDPWQINAFFDICSGLDFANRIGIEELATKVDTMLAKIRIKYKEHNIKEDPYVIVKANNGTYGMGIMVVRSSEDILSINRKSRNKMAVIKDGQNVSEVIIQEGVHTFEELEGNVAEPVVYMMDNSVIGGFYRVHPEKGKDENLNAVGANFKPLTFATPCISEFGAEPDCPPNRFYTYGVIARLALLASSMELATYI
mgnify:CR=1 FL=1